MADSKSQIELIKRDAEMGFPAAQYLLGFAYRTGKGLPQDLAKALEWYTKSAQEGYLEAQQSLYSMYRKGIGVRPDPAKAAGWAMKAAHAGNVQSQANLGFLYLNGNGVAKDRTLAYAWMSLASVYGYRPWHHRLCRVLVKRSLTAAELKNAQTFIIDWQETRRKKLSF
jgi:hypothetical protein